MGRLWIVAFVMYSCLATNIAALAQPAASGVVTGRVETNANSQTIGKPSSSTADSRENPDESKKDCTFMLNPLCWGDQINKGVGWILALAVGLASLTTAFIGARRNFKVARINVLLSCHKTYDEILDGFKDLQIEMSKVSEKDKLTKDGVILSAKKLYGRYWGLQHAQFRYFISDLVAEADLRHWLSCRYAEYNLNVDDRFDFHEITLQGTWKTKTKKDSALYYDPRFIEVMNAAMDIGWSGSADNNRRELAVDHAIRIANIYKRNSEKRGLFIAIHRILNPSNTKINGVPLWALSNLGKSITLLKEFYEIGNGSRIHFKGKNGNLKAIQSHSRTYSTPHALVDFNDGNVVEIPFDFLSRN